METWQAEVPVLLVTGPIGIGKTAVLHEADALLIEADSRRATASAMLQARRCLSGRLGLAVLIMVLTAACSGGNVTPDILPAPAFAGVAPLRQERCGAQVCVSQRVKNYGDRGGSGQCVLHGIWSNTASPGADVVGPTVAIPRLEPGDETTVKARWVGTVPDDGLRFLCEPGIRL